MQRHENNFEDPVFLKKLETEYGQLSLLVSAQAAEARDGKIIWAVHAPPALARLCEEYAEAYVHQANIPVADEETRRALVHHLSLFGESLFRFGQYCAQRGMLYANLTTCNCATVTDEDLARLLGGEER